MKNTNLIIFNEKTIKGLFNRLNSGTSVFGYKGYIVHLDYQKGEYLKLFCVNEDTVMELMLIVNEILTDIVVVAYYLMDSDNFHELMSTVEWHINPDKRRNDLIDGVGLDFRCINLRVYEDPRRRNSSIVKRLRNIA